MRVRVKIRKPEEIFISTDFIRLDSFLKFAAVAATGGEAKAFIQDGEVLVNGEPCLARGKKLFPGDKVRIFGRVFSVVRESGYEA